MKVKKFEIEDDDRVKKLKIKKENASSNDLDIEDFDDGITVIKNEKKQPHSNKPRKIIDPDGKEQDLLFAYCTGSRWVYINGRWYKIG